MFVRAIHFHRLPAVLLAVAALWVAGLPAAAQAPPPVAPAQFDPSDVYFQAYLAARSAEDLEKDENFTAAIEKLEQADKLLDSVTTYYPKWKTDMVKGRVAKTREAITRVRPKADEQRRREQGVIAELEGGVRNPVQPVDPPGDWPPNILQADPLAAKRLKEQDAEVERLRKVLQDSITPPAEVARQADRVKQLETQREVLKQQLRAAEASAADLRARFAKAPVASEVQQLNQRIGRLEQEREAMAMALTQSRQEHTKTLAQAAVLEADLKNMSQQAADLQRDLDVQRKVTNNTVTGMRKQLRDLQDSLTEKNKELAAAHSQIAGLKQELQESRDAFDQLREERDDLAAQRDQMKALFNLNEAGRIQELIEQNMAYAKKVREANEKLDALGLDNNATKDQLLVAKNELTVAKARINSLIKDRRAQDRKLADLEARLRREQGALAAGEGSSDPTEIAMLRDLIKRQLRSQERKRQASKILIEAAKQLGSQDEIVNDAIAMLEGEEIQLTPEEQRLIADRADVELISPFAQDPERVAQNNLELGKNIASYDRAATKAFAADRMLPARELFQLILEDHPGHIASLCKLGVVNLRLNDLAAATDTFRRAVELDPNNPYAHRMLGFTLMNLGDLPGAEQSVRRSVDLAPGDAKNQNLLATITYRLGRAGESESLYKAAIAADPIPSEPYFNLALLCARDKRFDDARSYYQKALERGAVPDIKLEQSLAAQ
jgi:Flp pilus assembly protein TadD